MRKLTHLLLLICLCISLNSWAQSGLRVEPPFWFAKMPTENLQLMIHGENIGKYTANINHKGITMVNQVSGDSPNYKFIYLEINPDVPAGSFEVNLTDGSDTKTFKYELKARVKDAARQQGFSSEDVIYLLMPDRFANGNPNNDTIEGMLEPARRDHPSGRHGGDIKGVQDHLDYIKNLGMTAVWLTPVFENDQTPEYKAYHGYAATDMFKVDRRFGTNEEFAAFVKASHDKGLKVIMDMIHNHIGDQHWWMKDLPFKNWVHDQSVYGNTNYRGVVASDPYASKHDTDKLLKGWFVNEMPDLDQRNPQLADYLIQNTLWWIEFSGIDGIRMDTYVYPYKEYMARWSKEVLEAYPTFNIVGESWVETVAHESYWQQDKAGENDGYDSYLPSVTDFQIQFAIRDAFNQDFGWDTGLMKLYYALTQDRLYSDPMKNVIFLDNHDISRIYSTLGERLENLKMAYAFLLTTRGIPQVYYGTELAFKAGPGQWGDGAKRAEMPGGWPGDSRSVFTKEGRTAEENSMHEYVTKLTNWRKTSDAVQHGKLLHFLPVNNVYVYFRYTDRERVMVIMNMNDSEATISREKHIEMLRGYTFGMGVISGKNYNVTQDFTVPARSTTIITLK